MKTVRLQLSTLLPVILLAISVSVHAQTVCDTPEAKLGNNFIQIAPNGTDDTDTIQCALDLAVEKNIPEVRLTRGEFFTAPLFAQNFEGTLQGGGEDYTRLSLLPGQDCTVITGFIKFAGGEPRLRWLTLDMTEQFPCSKGFLGAAVHFTGVSKNATACSYDVVYATIDRVTLEGPGYDDIGPWGVNTGILMSPEKSQSSSCRHLLLGSFKLNRSRVAGFPLGAAVRRLRGGAYLGVNKSDFDGNHTGLRIEDSNARVTVSGNYFASTAAGSNSSCFANPSALQVLGNLEDVSPGITRLDIHGNTFDVRAGFFFCHSIGLELSQQSGQTILNPIISNNFFQLTRENFDQLIDSNGISGGVLNSNFIKATGVDVDVATVQIQNGSDWTVVLNEGFEYTEEQIDIALGANTNNILIGPAQSATVKDEGTNNIVLTQ
jgi:hypothetical protein